MALSSSGPATQAKNDLGIFRETTRVDDGVSVNVQAVHQERIAEDPDLLRQWIHHRRAEFLFSHWALGRDPQRFLLYPDNQRVARDRLG